MANKAVLWYNPVGCWWIIPYDNRLYRILFPAGNREGDFSMYLSGFPEPIQLFGVGGDNFFDNIHIGFYGLHIFR